MAFFIPTVGDHKLFFLLFVFVLKGKPVLNENLWVYFRFLLEFRKVVSFIVLSLPLFEGVWESEELFSAGLPL